MATHLGEGDESEDSITARGVDCVSIERIEQIRREYNNVREYPF